MKPNSTIILCTALGVMCGVAKAQDLTMRLLPKDLTAVVNQRNDLNGNACAVIKMKVPCDTAYFDGNIVGSVERVDSAFVVYVTPGTRHLRMRLNEPFGKASKKGNRDAMVAIDSIPDMIVFSKYGIEAVQPNFTYEITLIEQND